MSQLPQLGEVVDDVFRVDAELGHGNFGAVYRVHDLLEGRTLALKVLKPGPHDEQELRQRFEREARLVYSLHHPHVLRVYYYGQTASGLPYMAMEFLEGTDLRALLAHHGPLSPRLVKRIALETLSALEAAHELGIVHRDLKPANIFLVNDGGNGHVKVLDFGFAKALDDGGRAGDELTAAKTLVGTPAYMSPELVHKKNVGAQADIYALGLIMAEMLTGKKIVQIESIYDTIMFQASDKPIKFPPTITESIFADIIQRAVEKDVNARYQTPTDMVLDLATLETRQGARRRRASSLVHAQASGEDAMTTPHATGLPSMAEVNRALATSQSITATNPHGSIDPFADFPDYEPQEAPAHSMQGSLRQRSRTQSRQLRAEPTDTTTRRNSYDVGPSQARQSQLSQRLPSLATHDAQSESSITQPALLPEPAQQQWAAPTPEFRDPSWASPAPQTDSTTQFERGNVIQHFNDQPLSAELQLDHQRPASSNSSTSRSHLIKEALIGVGIGGAILGIFIFLLQYW
ncbi:serine/threonine-protein kinase [Bradymonas sediminis]|uniref:Uncharacterized protein n=1 Tax=Bradymonas sediminis TaxID=1548548 RepID=A0A2Z4FPN0_9DELT|nr:serine/threonine-protein kinase [Bradymonas sediminis]AWV90618.1 hypothetical protein DN745_15315 [Bradymonas sediminis]TDP62383.1 serine/threonine protein kinase [Bradymonas sediminis]